MFIADSAGKGSNRLARPISSNCWTIAALDIAACLHPALIAVHCSSPMYAAYLGSYSVNDATTILIPHGRQILLHR